MRHHTKDKGDIGLTQVLADLVQYGIQVCLPISEHLPFDLIAVSPRGKLARVQVKFAALKAGVLNVNLRSSYSDRHGVHIKKIDRQQIDAYAVYSPSEHVVFYIHKSEISPSAILTLRISTPKNNQVSGVRFASAFVNPMQIFK